MIHDPSGAIALILLVTLFWAVRSWSRARVRDPLDSDEIKTESVANTIEVCKRAEK